MVDIHSRAKNLDRNTDKYISKVLVHVPDYVIVPVGNGTLIWSICGAWAEGYVQVGVILF